jgi:hypothetical protein
MDEQPDYGMDRRGVATPGTAQRVVVGAVVWMDKKRDYVPGTLWLS